MTQKICNVILGLGLVVVAALSLSSGSAKGILGGASTYETYPIHFVKGLYAGTTNQLTVADTGALTVPSLTVNAGNVSISNTSTSSLTVGCQNTYATSSATAIKVTFITTSTSTNNVNGVTPNGFVTWNYGTCP
jgi:hypothetical protein